MTLDYDRYVELTGDTNTPEEIAQAAIDSACAMVEKLLNRKLERGRYTEERYFDRPVDRVNLKAYPVEEIHTITGAEKRHLDHACGILRFVRPVAGAVTVEYTGGFTEVPAPVVQACALLATAIIQSNDNGGKTVMSERLGDYQVMFYNADQTGNGSLNMLSAAANALLAPYRG